MGVFRKEAEQVVTASLQAQPYSAYRGMTAAAATVDLRNKSTVELLKKRRAASVWQDDAWEYYDAIGEIKYAFRLFTNVLSRIRLYAAVVEDEDKPPHPIANSSLTDTEKQEALRAMRRVFPAASQPNMLRKAGINLLVTGECYLVKLEPKYGVRDREEWRVISVNELDVRDKKYFIKEEPDQKPIDMEELPDGAFCGRIWNQHARYSGQADSSMRGLIDLCDDLFLFSRAARASARSRLNAGALLVPDTLSMSSDVATDVVGDEGDDPLIPIENLEPDDDEFEDQLTDAMSAPIADEGSASSVVPLLIRGPIDALKVVRLLKFERSFDPQLAQRAERALERILQGIDLPKDIVTGLANIKYSNAVQIEESLYTAHIEPLVLMICDAFRTVYLEPALRKAGLDQNTIDKIVIWYDPSAIMTAPDKSNAANTGHDKYALSDSAWRRANGFAETDAPDEDELGRRLAISRGQLNEEVTTALLKKIMPTIIEAARADSIANSPSPLPQNVQDVLDGAPRPPDQPGEEAAPAAPPSAGGGQTPAGATPGLPPIVGEAPKEPTQ